MGGEWQETTLDKLIEVKHGFAFKGTYFRDEPCGDVLLTPGNFAIGGGFKTDKFKYYDGPVPDDFVLHEGDLIITMTDLSKGADTLGYPAIVPKSADGRRFLHNQRLGKVVTKAPGTISLMYLNYLMRGPAYRHEIIASATGTTVKHTSPKRIKLFRFHIPPFSEQQAIACILGALDDKIELNRRMNRTLEDMARTIFKSWFVNFDPVRAKAAGQQPPLPAPQSGAARQAGGLKPELADLFPDSFENSEMGEIPRGWKLSMFESVLNVLETGSRPKGGVKNIITGIPSVGAESIVGIGQFDFSKTKYVPEEFYHKMKKGKAESRDVLLYKDGGKPGLYEPHVSMFGDGFPFDAFCINEHVYRMRANEKATQNYLYFWLTSDLAFEEMRIKGTGVAIPGLNSTAVKSLNILVPLVQLLSIFDKLAEPLVARLFSNCKVSLTLTNLRDTLLPKLISGELRVPDAERIAGRCL